MRFSPSLPLDFLTESELSRRIAGYKADCAGCRIAAEQSALRPHRIRTRSVSETSKIALLLPPIYTPSR